MFAEHRKETRHIGSGTNGNGDTAGPHRNPKGKSDQETGEGTKAALDQFGYTITEAKLAALEGADHSLLFGSRFSSKSRAMAALSSGSEIGVDGILSPDGARLDAAVVMRAFVAACAFGAAAIHFGFAPDHFGKAVGPAIGNPVGGRRVDDPHLAAFGHGNGGQRCIVGQAQHGKVRSVKGVAPRRIALALFVIQHD